MMFATMFGRNEVVKLLLESGADTGIPDIRGQSAFDLAMQQGNTEAMSLLTSVFCCAFLFAIVVDRLKNGAFSKTCSSRFEAGMQVAIDWALTCRRCRAAVSTTTMMRCYKP